jgi:hypothetical protein
MRSTRLIIFFSDGIVPYLSAELLSSTTSSHQYLPLNHNPHHSPSHPPTLQILEIRSSHEKKIIDIEALLKDSLAYTQEALVGKWTRWAIFVIRALPLVHPVHFRP